MDLTHKCIIVKKAVFLIFFSCVNEVWDFSLLWYLQMECLHLFSFRSHSEIDLAVCFWCSVKPGWDKNRICKTCWNAPENLYIISLYNSCVWCGGSPVSSRNIFDKHLLLCTSFGIVIYLLESYSAFSSPYLYAVFHNHTLIIELFFLWTHSHFTWGCSRFILQQE